MFCTRCGIQIDDEDKFCRHCGKSTAPPAAAFAPGQSRLSLPQDVKKIGGVCAGFARYLGVDVTLVRILWLTLAVMTGVGFVAYLIAWIVMPKDPLSMVPANAQPVGQPS